MEIQAAEELNTDHRHATAKAPTGDTQPGFLHGRFKEIKRRRWGDGGGGQVVVGRGGAGEETSATGD